MAPDRTPILVTYSLPVFCLSDPASPHTADHDRLLDTNRRFYNDLWKDSQLVSPDQFNTWPLVCRLNRDGFERLEVGPGMRPRLPIAGTHFADISEPALRTLRAEGGHTESAVIGDLPYEDGRFDLISALDIIEHVENDEQAMRELTRVAAPGARILLSTPLHPEYWTRFDEIVGHYRRYTPNSLFALLERHGLTIDQSGVFGMKPRSSLLTRLGMWFLQHHRDTAMHYYNRYFMPLALKRQKALQLYPGMIPTEDVGEVFLVCRRVT